MAAAAAPNAIPTPAATDRDNQPSADLVDMCAWASVYRFGLFSRPSVGAGEVVHRKRIGLGEVRGRSSSDTYLCTYASVQYTAIPPRTEGVLPALLAGRKILEDLGAWKWKLKLRRALRCRIGAPLLKLSISLSLNFVFHALLWRGCEPLYSMSFATARGN